MLHSWFGTQVGQLQRALKLLRRRRELGHPPSSQAAEPSFLRTEAEEGLGLWVRPALFNHRCEWYEPSVWIKV